MLHLHNPGAAYERYFVSRYQRNGNVLAGTVVDQGGHRVDFRSGASRLIMLVRVSELKYGVYEERQQGRLIKVG